MGRLLPVSQNLLKRGLKLRRRRAPGDIPCETHRERCRRRGKSRLGEQQGRGKRGANWHEKRARSHGTAETHGRPRGQRTVGNSSRSSPCFYGTGVAG